MKNALYFQSGGPTAVINSSLYGVIEEAFLNKNIGKLYGAHYGLQGVIEKDLYEFNKPLEYYNDLLKTSGAALGSARLMLKENDPLYGKILECIKEFNIGYVFVNGGNDSMDTADKLNNYFKTNNIDCYVIGISKTIDNDLVLTDHTPGFGSACKYVNKTIMDISSDVNSYKKGRVTICEIMGRDAGWLAASSGYANEYGLGPDLIYLPEIPFIKKDFLHDVEKIFKKQGHVLVCVSEALKDENGEYVSTNGTLDAFGHKQLGSVSKYLDDLVVNELNIKTRHIEFSLIQRCSTNLMSSNDQLEAINVGRFAVKSALEHKVGMVSIKRISNNPYKVDYELVDLSKVANSIKHMPRCFINEKGNGVTKEYLEYIKPFIDADIIPGKLLLK